MKSNEIKLVVQMTLENEVIPRFKAIFVGVIA